MLKVRLPVGRPSPSVGEQENQLSRAMSAPQQRGAAVLVPGASPAAGPEGGLAGTLRHPVAEESRPGVPRLRRCCRRPPDRRPFLYPFLFFFLFFRSFAPRHSPAGAACRACCVFRRHGERRAERARSGLQLPLLPPPQRPAAPAPPPLVFKPALTLFHPPKNRTTDLFRDVQKKFSTRRNSLLQRGRSV